MTDVSKSSSVVRRAATGHGYAATPASGASDDAIATVAYVREAIADAELSGVQPGDLASFARVDLTGYASLSQISSPAVNTLYHVVSNGVGTWYVYDGSLFVRVTPDAQDLSNYVTKVAGKGLSTNDFTTALKSKLEGIDTDLYVEKEDGKGLSTEDYTSAEKAKVARIPSAGAIATESYVTNAVGVQISGLATATSVTNLSGRVDDVEDAVEGLTGSLSGLATTDYVDNAIAELAGIDLSDLATSSDLNAVENRVASLEAQISGFPPSDSLVTVDSLDAAIADALTDTAVVRGAVETAVGDVLGDFYREVGSVPTVAQLPAGASRGDVYKVLADRHRYVWTGLRWDDLCGDVPRAQIISAISGVFAPSTLSPTADPDIYELAGAGSYEARTETPVPDPGGPYLFSVAFTDTYEAEGAAYRQSHYGILSGGCSAFKAGRWFARSYDWEYSHAATFRVSVTAADGRYASVGTSSLGSDLPASMAGVFTELHKCLPGLTKDGRNSAGVAISMNVVPHRGTGDWPSEPSGTRDTDAIVAVRRVLDGQDTAEHAAQWLASHVYLPQGYVDRNHYSIHYLVADASGAYVVEDGAYRDVSSSPVMTNFRRMGTNGSLSMSRSDVARWDPYGAGIERAAVISAGLAAAAADTTPDAAVALIRSVRYTRMYPSAPGAASPLWYSELCGSPSGASEGAPVLGLSSPDYLFADALSVSDTAYRGRSRSSPTLVTVAGVEAPVATWQSVWQVVYDLDPSTPVESACAWIRTQEDYGPYAPVPVASAAASGSGGFSPEMVAAISAIGSPKASTGDLVSKFNELVRILTGGVQ